ncbi:MAG TPA: methyltransferase domain-containing protein [Pirellulales bacterium]|nr:methyltransferase domain-containing protein [Pirellulales bacterium]
MIDKSLLVRWLGFPATLIHGDTLVLDRWQWLRRRLPPTRDRWRLLDVGCGTGAFTIGTARLGYEALGLSWDERNRAIGARRALLCNAPEATFELCDVRQLGTRTEWFGQFDVAICLETIEHVLDDLKLMRDIVRCLKPGGRLLLTTPYFHYRAITAGDNGPFSTTETGAHVRRGYTRALLEEMCDTVGLHIEDVSYCSGWISQKSTGLMRLLSKVHPLLGWATILPLRPLIPVLDGPLTRLLKWPSYSICLEAYKPRDRAAMDGSPHSA